MDKQTVAELGTSMSGFQGYDQWKTASPHDDEPDPIEEAEKFLEIHQFNRKSGTHWWFDAGEVDRACTIIEALLAEI